MPKINILNILSGDNQSTVVDKINYNFDQILSAGGGPQGQQGLIGATGPVGPQGVPGIQGAKGDQGTKWFVQGAPGPAGSSVGDYWLDINSSEQTIYQNVAGVWTTSGYGFSTGDIFQRLNPVKAIGTSQINKTAIVFGGVGGTTTGPKSTSLVLSDSPVNTGTSPGYSPGQVPELYIRNVNQEDSKLKIATEGRLNLISFSRSDLDMTLPYTGDGRNNPTISWLDPAITTNPYDIAFKNPTGGISITTDGTLRGPINLVSASDAISIRSLGYGTFGGVNIESEKQITAKSNSNNISIFTASANKGTFIRFNSSPSTPAGINGFVEMNTNVTSAINSTTPSFFANATGVGIGVGGLVGSTFKQTGADPRKLAVLGNISISKAGVDHETTNMFFGINGQNDYDKGSLFVRGHGAFGHNDPRTDETSGLTTIGPSETGNSFPRLFVTSSRNGQVFQVKNAILNGSQASVSRTTLGNGTFDQSTVTDKTSAGAGPDLTQEFFTSGYTFTADPLISLQHKITNALNVTDTATVFSISTFTIAGTYDSGTIADKTLIQTKNSNSNLRIFANATSTANKGNNKVIIGARDKPLIAVFGGTDTDPDRGTVSIGMYAEGNKGLVGPYSTSIISFVNSQYNHHALNLRGVQTIGSTEPYSAFALVSPTGDAKYSISTNRDVGTVSMLKIQRLFGSVSSTNYNVNGYKFNNIANGIEIISYKTGINNPWDANANKSVAIAVGASTNSKTSPTTGFFVSDEGTCVSIGSYIDYDFALKVTGSAGVIGNISATGLLTGSGGIFTTGTNVSGGTGRGVLLWDTGTGANEGLFLDWKSGANGTFAGIVGYSEATGGGIGFYTTSNNSGSQGSKTTRTLRMSIAANGTVSIPGTFSVSNMQSTDSISISNPNAFLGINTYYGANLPSDSNAKWRAIQSGNGMWFKIEDASSTGKLHLYTFGNTSAGGAVTAKSPIVINTNTGSMNILGPIYVGWEQPLAEANGGYAYYYPSSPGYSPNSTQVMNTEDFDRHVTIYYSSGSNGYCTLEVQTSPGGGNTANLAAVGVIAHVGSISGLIPAGCTWRLRCWNSDHNSYPKATVYLRKFGHM